MPQKQSKSQGKSKLFVKSSAKGDFDYFLSDLGIRELITLVSKAKGNKILYQMIRERFGVAKPTGINLVAQLSIIGLIEYNTDAKRWVVITGVEPIRMKAKKLFLFLEVLENIDVGNISPKGKQLWLDMYRDVSETLKQFEPE